MWPVGSCSVSSALGSLANICRLYDVDPDEEINQSYTESSIYMERNHAGTPFHGTIICLSKWLLILYSYNVVVSSAKLNESAQILCRRWKKAATLTILMYSLLFAHWWTQYNKSVNLNNIFHQYKVWSSFLVEGQRNVLSIALSMGCEQWGLKVATWSLTANMRWTFLVQGKVVPVHATKAYGGSRGKTPPILSLGTRWRWMVNFTPPLFYLREGTLIRTEQGARYGPFW